MTIRWNLTGTENQRAIARRAFEQHLFFPQEALTALPGTPELGWADLNNGTFALAAKTDGARAHEGHHPGDEDKPDALEGFDELGRRQIHGLIYTQSGRIYIDVSLESKPLTAMGTIIREFAHAVDFFLPMTDAQREELMRLWNVAGTTWWEVFSYGDEYFRLGGEAWMDEFGKAYSSGLDFGNTPFIHDAGVEAADVYRILGINRTDYVAPAPDPTPTPTPPVVEPEQPISPSSFKHFPGGKDIYHKLTHYPKKPGVPLETFEGFDPCKVCRP